MALVNYWKLNSDYTDAVGGLNLSGSLNPTSKPYAGINGAYSFSGTNKRLVSSSNITLPTAMSFSINFYPDFTSDTYYRVMGVGDDIALNADGLYLQKTGTTLKFVWFVRQTSNSNLFLWNYDGTYSDYSGKWNTWTATRPSISGTWKFYINGKLVSPTQDYALGAPNSPTDRMGVAQIGRDTATNFKGLLDEARVYNHELTASEAKNLYASYKGFY